MAFGQRHRREFITLLGGAATWALGARAQQPALPVIGFLSARSADESATLITGFLRGLSESGYVEGKISIEYRWADGRFDRLPGLAADLVRRRVMVIAAVTTPGALAAKAATSTIPIVFVAGGDPVKLGLVTALNQPGGNATGVGIVTFELLQKRMDLIQELVPSVSTIGLLINPTNTTAEFVLREVQEAARSRGRQIVTAVASSQAEFDSAFAALRQQGAG